MKQKGFTLIELLIVVAIIGIIVAIAIPNLLDAIDRSKQRATVADMRAWGNSLGAYMAEKGTYPPDGNPPPRPYADLASTIYSDLVPYAISTLRKEDYWKHPYRYFAADTTQYTIRSYGKDGASSGNLAVTPATWRDYTLDIILEDGIFTNSPE